MLNYPANISFPGVMSSNLSGNKGVNVSLNINNGSINTRNGLTRTQDRPHLPSYPGTPNLGGGDPKAILMSLVSALQGLIGMLMQGGLGGAQQPPYGQQPAPYMPAQPGYGQQPPYGQQPAPYMPSYGQQPSVAYNQPYAGGGYPSGGSYYPQSYDSHCGTSYNSYPSYNDCGSYSNVTQYNTKNCSTKNYQTKNYNTVNKNYNTVNKHYNTVNNHHTTVVNNNITNNYITNNNDYSTNVTNVDNSITNIDNSTNVTNIDNSTNNVVNVTNNGDGDVIIDDITNGSINTDNSVNDNSTINDTDIVIDTDIVNDTDIIDIDVDDAPTPYPAKKEIGNVDISKVLDKLKDKKKVTA